MIKCKRKWCFKKINYFSKYALCYKHEAKIKKDNTWMKKNKKNVNNYMKKIINKK